MRSRQRTTDWATHTFREHNTKKLTCGQARVRRGVQKNGWTPPALRGKRFLLYVDSGMEAMTTANAVEALSAWPSRNHTDGLLSTKVWPCTSSLDAEVGGCGMLIDNLHQWMEKCSR